MVLRVLLDSTYILPAFGIAVKGLSREDLEKLEQLRIEKVVEYHFTSLIWIEIVPKVLKEYSNRGISVNISMFERIALALENTAKHVGLGPVAIAIAAKLRALGHKDMVDNLLYGIASERDLLLLTMDSEFREFVHRHGLETSRIVNHRELFKQLRR